MNLKSLLPKTVVVGLAGAALAFSGCISAPFVPPVGMAFTQIKAPLDLDNANTPASCPKRGKAAASCVLGLFAFGDASTAEAARDGGLKTIQHADYEFFNILGIYQKTTVVVYGD